jgi:NADH-quinone oxidoreductase subunit H
MPELLRVILFIIFVLSFAGLNAAYLVWCERKGAAHVQRRIGPKEVGPYGLLQPLADGAKLMTKQLFLPKGVDPILFMIAPLMVMVPAIIAREINLGLLMIFAFASVNVLGLLLGAWGSANKYAVIAAARTVSQNVAYEIPMLITTITMVMVTNTMNLNEIIRSQAGWFFNWHIFRLDMSLLMPVSFLIFFVCSLAETNRAPFDMAEAESELIAGVYTEYPGMGFGVFFMGEYANIVIGCALTAILFLGGWQSPIPFNPAGFLGVVWGMFWFFLKLYALIFTVIWIRWTYPRTQFYELLNLSWKVLIPISLFNLILTALQIKIFPWL